MERITDQEAKLGDTILHDGKSLIADKLFTKTNGKDIKESGYKYYMVMPVSFDILGFKEV